MPRESRKDRTARARRIVRALFKRHPDATCALVHGDAYELLVATILSAQSTDKLVNRITPALFRRFPDAPSLAAAVPETVEQLIHESGFFRQKTKSLIGMARGLVERHGGAVPGSMDELVQLPGVGRKTANVILGNCFDVPGVVVDTHVARLAERMGLTRETDPTKIERDLMQLVPERDWTQFSHAMIFHGRRICSARAPRCEECPVFDDCPWPKRRGTTARKAGAGRTQTARARGDARQRARGQTGVRRGP